MNTTTIATGRKGSAAGRSVLDWDRPRVHCCLRRSLRSPATPKPWDAYEKGILLTLTPAAIAPAWFWRAVRLGGQVAPASMKVSDPR